jgi:osomolarity two-component system phosphorelay intermediate protein YPD1
VKDSCEKIQHYGARKDATGTKDETDDEVSVARIKDTVSVAKDDFEVAESKLRTFYDD